MEIARLVLLQAERIGVVIDVEHVKARMLRSQCSFVIGRRWIRLGRPNRAYVLVDPVANAIIGVRPSSPHAKAGNPNGRGGDSVSRAARAGARWQRRALRRAETLR